MAGYIGSKASVVSSGAERKKVFSITTTTTSLTGLSYTPNQVHVFHNGVRLVDGTDYTATNGTSITLTTAAENGDQVVVISYATFQPADTYTTVEADDRFVNVTGDTMTGALAVNGNLTVDTNTLFVNATSNNVGIGTISPGAKLVVAGGWQQITNGSSSMYVGDGVSLVSGSPASASAVRFDGDALLFSNSNIERMRIDTTGRVTQPFQPAFRAVRNTHVTSTGVIVFDTKSFDVGNNYNNSTGVFTAPVAGRYFFSFSTLLYSMGGNSYTALYVNGSFYSHFGTYGAFTGSYAGQGASTVADLSVNDAVTIYFSHNTTNLHQTYTWWSGYLLG